MLINVLLYNNMKERGGYMKIKRPLSFRAKKNRAIATILAIAVVGGMAYGVKALYAYTNQPKTVHVYTYTVQKGDTLWGIAEKYKSPREDVRQEMYDIANDNGLKMGDHLQPGQRLTIEVYR